ncbi:MAG: hypothetical protein JRI68_27590 [Deltaproteobacteria bacterium]|nr:hypothetical protein [Deltaproteobacteria bacterium]
MLNAASGVAPRLSSLRSDIPPALDDLVASLLHGDPQGRPGQVEAVAAQLDAIAAGRGAGAAPSWRPPAPLGPPAPVGAYPPGAAPGVTATTAQPGAYGAAQTVGTATPVVAPTAATAPSQSTQGGLLGLPVALLALSLLFVGGGAAGIYFGVVRAGDNAATATPEDECTGEYCERIRYADPSRVEVEEQLELAKEAVRRFVPKPKFLLMSVNRMTGGRLDMHSAKSFSSFSFAGAKPGAMLSVSFTIDWLVVVKSQPGESMSANVLQEPDCAAKKAWRAAVAAGLDQTHPVSASYMRIPQYGVELRPSWHIHDLDGPDQFIVDGKTCKVVRKQR